MRARLMVGVLIAIVGVILIRQGVESQDARPQTPSATASIAGSLPPEALETIALIRSDGPFPYRQDGVVFQNRERLLPSRERGYWREYTVPTPGESDRGARRIVHGKSDEFYYTDDHYASFRRVKAPELAKR